MGLERRQLDGEQKEPPDFWKGEEKAPQQSTDSDLFWTKEEEMQEKWC